MVVFGMVVVIYLAHPPDLTSTAMPTATYMLFPCPLFSSQVLREGLKVVVSDGVRMCLGHVVGLLLLILPVWLCMDDTIFQLRHEAQEAFHALRFA